VIGIIHRGTKEIGGSCVELAAGRTRILIDMGMPLVDEKGERFDSTVVENRSIPELISSRILPPIKGLYQGDAKGFDAVLLSHSHLDHYGLLRFINRDIPVLMSSGSQKLIEISSLFINANVQPKNVRIFKQFKPQTIGDFTVTPYLVDHSAFDATAFLVEGNGRRLFYSGDFRGHGRKGVLFERFLARPPSNINCLLMEGSMMDRVIGRYVDEKAIEGKFTQIFKEKDNIAFVFCSSQNIDRLVSVYRAAKRSESTMVIDLYTAYILDRLRTEHEHLPQYDWPHIRVKYFMSHRDTLKRSNNKNLLDKYSKTAITIEEINSDRKNIVMLMRDNSIFRACLRKMPDLEGSLAIYSMWDGYVNDRFLDTLKRHKIEYRYIHTSGHAVLDDLQKLAEALKPKSLIPIHTFRAHEYSRHFKNVRMVNDGEQVTI
jgi:ribonuclease J